MGAYNIPDGHGDPADIDDDEYELDDDIYDGDDYDDDYETDDEWDARVENHWYKGPR